MIRYLTVAVVLCMPLAVSAAQPDEAPPRWAANIARKQQVLMHGLPAAYANAYDPRPDNEAKLRRGRMLFDSHCATCHGWTGRGSGPEAFALVPAPADLEWLARKPKRPSEPYMYWTIAKGGRQFESEMPAFKGRLSKNDIWAVIAYVRAGLPRRLVSAPHKWRAEATFRGSRGDAGRPATTAAAAGAGTWRGRIDPGADRANGQPK